MKNIFKVLVLLFILIPACEGVSNAAEVVDWITLTKNAEFGERSIYAATTLNARVYISGGVDYKNDVWCSSNGVEWIALTKNAEFGERTKHKMLSYNNKLWVIGGLNSGTYFNDVWYSNDGVEWLAATKNAEFNPRALHNIYVFDNKMWVVGGLNASGKFADVWYSSNGVEWLATTKNAEFGARSFFNANVFDNKMWVIGGQTNSESYNNDVWYSLNGIEWVSTTKNAEFGLRYANGTVVNNNKIYLMGGFYDGVTYDDIWSSADGIVWNEVTSNNSWISREEIEPQVINNNIVVFGGLNWNPGPAALKDVWVVNINELTPTITPSFTALPTVDTPTPSTTPTVTLSNTPLPTDTITETNTPYYSPTASPTNTPWDTFTLTETITPTPSITATVTPTRTNTPLTTPTPTNTVTPILTLEPILRYVSTDYDNHKTTVRLEWTKYDDTGLQYYLTVYDPIYQHESTTVLNNTADMSPDLEWLTHDLIGLRYDYCYNIGLSITATDWASPVYASTIVICPYASPTPFAGTPTASNTPNCSVETATPSPQITIAVTVGYVLYDSNTGKDANTVYSGGASHAVGTYTYRNITRGATTTNTAVECTSNGATDYLAFRTYTSATEMIFSEWVYLNSSASGSFAVNQLTGDTTINDAQSHYGGFQYDANMYIANGGSAQTITHKVTMAANWYYLKFVCKTGTQKLYMWDVDKVLENAFLIPNYTYDSTLPGAPWGQIRFISSGGKINIDDFAITKSTTVTVKNMIDDSYIVVLDASNNTKTVLTPNASGEAQWNTEFEILPVVSKFLYYAPCGLTIYADTSNRDVFGGDVYMLSTPTP